MGLMLIIKNDCIYLNRFDLTGPQVCLKNINTDTYRIYIIIVLYYNYIKLFMYIRT